MSKPYDKNVHGEAGKDPWEGAFARAWKPERGGTHFVSTKLNNSQAERCCFGSRRNTERGGLLQKHPRSQSSFCAPCGANCPRSAGSKKRQERERRGDVANECTDKQTTRGGRTTNFSIRNKRRKANKRGSSKKWREKNATPPQPAVLPSHVHTIFSSMRQHALS